MWVVSMCECHSAQDNNQPQNALDCFLFMGADTMLIYRAIGNSMVVPVMRWIGERIGAVSGGGEPDFRLHCLLMLQ